MKFVLKNIFPIFKDEDSQPQESRHGTSYTGHGTSYTGSGIPLEQLLQLYSNGGSLYSQTTPKPVVTTAKPVVTTTKPTIVPEPQNPSKYSIEFLESFYPVKM